jgi:hypothetical protein
MQIFETSVISTKNVNGTLITLIQITLGDKSIYKVKSVYRTKDKILFTSNNLDHAKAFFNLQ